MGFIAKLIFLLLFSLTFKQLSFGQTYSSLVGDASSNAFTKIKPYSTGNSTSLYACGVKTTNGTSNATFSKISPTGAVQWSVIINTPSDAFDFEKIEGTNTNEFFVVGRTLPANVGNDNKSFIAKITENSGGTAATVSNVDLYDQNNRENFAQIIKKNDSGSWKYYVCGLFIDPVGGGTLDNGVVHVFNGSGTLLNRWQYIDPTAFDNELGRGLINWGSEILVYGVRRGNDGFNFGTFYTINPTTGAVVINKRMPNNMYILDAFRGTNGDLYLTGNILGTSDSYIARLDRTTFNTKWIHTLTGDNVLYDISDDGAGNLYVISQTPGSNYWINKIQDNPSNATLISSRRIFETGDNTFSSGRLRVNAGSLYYADSRIKTTGFGQTDIVLLKQGLNLENFNCTTATQKSFPAIQATIQDLTITLTALQIPPKTTAQGDPLVYERKSYCGQPCTASFTASQKPCGMVEVTNTSTGSPLSYIWCNGATTSSIPNITIPCNQSVTVCLTATCQDGSTSIAANQVFTYTDVTPPTITCPANKTINCNESTLPTNTGSPIATDPCGIKSSTYVDGISIKLVCGFSFNRTWTVEDNCGNKSTCTQAITVADNVPPIITCPTDKTLTCSNQNVLGTTGTATATDNCSQAIDISITYTDIVSGVADCDQVIKRTWVAKDRCGNTSSCIQTIFVRDNVKPIISNCPPNVTISGVIDANGKCTGTTTLSNPTATDNCDVAVTITNNAPAVYPARNTTVVWTATDDCGNTATCSTVVTVKCENCACGTFSNTYYRPSQGAPNIIKNCGDTLEVACKPAFNPIIGGTFNCVGVCPTVAPISWQLLNPAGSLVASGTVPLSGATFAATISGALLNTTGVYQLVLTGQCGNQTCPPCRFYIKVNCNNPNDCGYVQNSKFDLGTPTGDQGINSATNWTGIWPGTGCSTGDFYNTSTAPPPFCTPTPATQGNYGAFWVNKTSVADVVWREGIMNKLNATINANTGCYEVEFKIACLRTPLRTPFLKVYGVNTSGPATACPAFGTLNTALFSDVKDLGTHALTSGCNCGFQTVKMVFNTSTWTLGTVINHIFFTRSDDTDGHTYVALDDVCITKVNCGNCQCGSVNNVQVLYTTPTTPVSITCNNTTPVKIPCRKFGPNFFIHGNIPCSSNDCGQNILDWKLTRPASAGGTLTGTIAMSSNVHFDLNLPWSHFATAGAYQLEVTRYCGDKPCKCVFNFVVEACPCSCDALKDEVKKGFNVTGFKCIRNLKPVALCPSDAVVWTITRLTGGTWNTTLSSTGSSSLSVGFPGSGWYNVCMTVSRTVNGVKCEDRFYCKKIFVWCPIINPTGSVSTTCINNVILNGNFTDTSRVAGELGNGGVLGNWSPFKKGDGITMVEDSIGAFDEGSITTIGRNNNYAGISQKVNLSKNNFAHVRFQYRNWQNGNTPKGTVIEFFLAPNATNDLGAQLLHRINVVDQDTSNAWITGSFTVGGNINFDNKYFVCCVRNEETDNIFSVISFDNFELCSLETTAAKEEILERVKIQVFPNPNSGDFNIQLPFLATEKMKLRVTDLTGRILTEKQPSIGDASQHLELNGIANGLYIIQIVQEGRVIGVERFVKQ